MMNSLLVELILENLGKSCLKCQCRALELSLALLLLAQQNLKSTFL